MKGQPDRRSTGRFGAVLFAAAVVVGACGPGEDTAATSGSDSVGSGGGVYGSRFEASGQSAESGISSWGSSSDSDPTDSPAGDQPEADNEVEEESVGVEGPCDPALVGEEEGEISVVYRVRNGQLDDVCFGSPQAVAEEGWDALALVAPPEQLDAVVLYAAYEGETDTLAFAGPIDSGNDDFVIAIDAVAGGDDPEELQLTMLHEFAHVFTQTPDQLDIDVSLVNCDTYWNGFGCFKPGSFMADWVAEFWPEDTLATLPKKGGIDEEGGADRCDLDPQFLGSYAASHPEEDFAESFSAYVFAVDVPEEVRPRFVFFATRPELAAFADRAAAADRVGLDGNFNRCG